jgi:hypothetical protein
VELVASNFDISKRRASRRGFCGVSRIVRWIDLELLNRNADGPSGRMVRRKRRFGSVALLFRFSTSVMQEREENKDAETSVVA